MSSTTNVVKTESGWQARHHVNAIGDPINIKLIFDGSKPLEPIGVRVFTRHSSTEFEYNHNRSSTENAADCLALWLSSSADAPDYNAEAAAERQGFGG